MSQTMTVTRPAEAYAPPKISYEDFLVQYDGVHAEWVDGEVEFMSPISDAHQEISVFLLRLMTEFVEVYQLGIVRYEPFQMKLITTPRGREPDIMFISQANRANMQPNYLNGPADLVIEIISPESIDRDRVKKFTEYQSGGVPEYWIIDPLIQQVNFFQRDGNGHFQSISSDADGIYHSTGLPGFWVREEWFWQLPTPSMSTMRKEFGLP
ncbi:MAG: Uma2 family endonuclease [Janthinobacterium lividum]